LGSAEVNADVIDHQRRCGKQPCSFAQVFRRHGIAATTAGVGSNGLSIAEKDDYQQDQDGGDDRQQVLCPKHAQRDQQRQRGLRAIRRAG
jgi:hypothetical protein